MRAIAHYAATNTVTRALLPELLTREQFEGLIRTASPEEAWEVLTKTGLGNWLPPYSGQDPLVLEALIHRATALRFARSIRLLRGKVGHAAAALLSRWDVDALLIALRLWHGRTDPQSVSGLPETFTHSVPIAALVRAPDLRAVAELLKATPYGTPLRLSIPRYEAHHTLLPVETAIEREHYRRILKAIDHLDELDARDGKAVIGTEIDLLNLAAVSRLVEYRHANPATLAECLVPGPGPISLGLIIAHPSAESVQARQEEFLKTLAFEEPVGGSVLERLARLERFLYEQMARHARKALLGFPFRLAVILAFHALSRLEFRNLRAVLAAKVSRLEPASIWKHVYGLG